MGASSNGNVAIRFLKDVVDGGNLALIEELVHREASDSSGPWPKGRDGFRDHISWFRMAFEPEITIERVIADEDYAVVYWNEKGHHVGPAFGIEATGRPAENSMISTMRFQDDMTVEYEVMLDMLKFVVQVGCLGPWASNFPR